MHALFEMLGDVLLAVLRFCLELPVVWVGEITLWAVTLGRREPRWDAWRDEAGFDFVFLTSVSFWIGLLTIALIGLLLKFLLGPGNA